jgi:hypothetical protein
MDFHTRAYKRDHITENYFGQNVLQRFRQAQDINVQEKLK